MGYLGIFAGVLVLFQIIQVPIVQGYWLLARRLPALGPLADRRAPGVADGQRRAVAVVGRDARPAGGGAGGRRVGAAGAGAPTPALRRPASRAEARGRDADAHPLQRPRSASASAAR